MKKEQLIRAWKDPKYRRSLSAADRARLAAHPAGGTMVTDEDLNTVAGGCGPTACNNCGFSGRTGLCSGCGNVHCF